MLAFILVLQLAQPVQAPPPSMIQADIVAAQTRAGSTLITIGAGSADGIVVGRCGDILQLPGSGFCIARTTAHASKAIVKLPISSIKQSSLRVEVSP